MLTDGIDASSADRHRGVGARQLDRRPVFVVPGPSVDERFMMETSDRPRVRPACDLSEWTSGKFVREPLLETIVTASRLVGELRQQCSRDRSGKRQRMAARRGSSAPAKVKARRYWRANADSHN